MIHHISDTIFCCSQVAGSATNFSLPVTQVRQMATYSMSFRMEITRALSLQQRLALVVLPNPGSNKRSAFSSRFTEGRTGCAECAVEVETQEAVEMVSELVSVGCWRCANGFE